MKPIEKPVVMELEDPSHGTHRIEIRSRVGDSYLGHVFIGDPESPNDVRYCTNSTSPRFAPYIEIRAESYGYPLYPFEE